MEASEKNLIISEHRFKEINAQMCDGERCLCCEAAFGCKVELFNHLKTKHWPTVFDVIMMGPGSDPVGRWIDRMLSNKCKYDGAGMPNNEETLSICSRREGVESSDMTDVSVKCFDLPDESSKELNLNHQLEKSDCTEVLGNKHPDSETLSFHSIVSEADSDMNNVARVDSEAAIYQQKVVEEWHLINCASVDERAEASGNEKTTPSELRQHREAVVEGVDESVRSTVANTHCCRLCGESVEERLPHVLQAHLKAEIFQCRQCHFFSHSRPKDVFDHISTDHPDDLNSLNLFCNRLDEHRVGIDQLLLNCFGIDDPVDLTAVMCGSSIRGFLDGLEFFRRALQADRVTTARQPRVDATATEPTLSDALNKPEPDQIANTDGNIAITHAADADESLEDQEPSVIIADPEQAAAAVVLMDDDDDSDSEVIFTNVVDAARSPIVTISPSRPGQTSVEELRNEFRNIDGPDSPAVIVEEPTDSLARVRRGIANQNDPPRLIDSPTVCPNVEAQSVERDEEMADESVISITVPNPEPPTTSALESSKNEIGRSHPSRRSARMTPSSARQEQPITTPLEQTADVVIVRSLRQTPGRQALAAEQRTLRAAAQLTSETAHQQPPKRQALKRSSTEPTDRSNAKSRPSTTPPPITPSKERLQTLRSHLPSAAVKPTSTPTTSTSAPRRTEPTLETSPSPTVSRKSLRVNAGGSSDRVDAHSSEKSTVVESDADASTSKKQLRRSAASVTTDKRQSTSPVQTTATPGSVKEVTCRECRAVVKFRERVRHVLRQHVRVPLYECPVAGCGFSSSTNLSHCREHVSNVHKRDSGEAIDNRSKYQQQIDEWMRKCL